MNAFDILQNFFYELTTEEAIWLLILGLLVFTVGLILGWILQYGRTKRYRKQALLYQQDATNYEFQYKQADEQQKALARELETASRDKVALLDELQAVRAELNTLRNVPPPEPVDNREEIEVLNTKLRELEAENEHLRSTPPAQDDLPPDHTPYVPVMAPAADNANDLETYLEAIDARFQAFEARLDELAAGSSRQDSVQGFSVPDDDFMDVPASDVIEEESQEVFPEVEVGPDGEPLVIVADTAKPGARYGQNGDVEVVVQNTPSLQVPVTEVAVDADDLTRIKSIGPYLENRLNEADIYRYAQIAGWSAADIATYTEMIEYVPGAIEAQDWVGQAQQFLVSDSEKTDISDASPLEGDGLDLAPTAMIVKEDKLRKIEGIGPKIEAVLRKAGVDSYATLADKSPDELRAILEAANSRYRSHNPNSWPHQASLARDGYWEELARLQQELVGGRAKK